ncbi:MAG TPA: choice-of-anchor Q domain-containing protein [Verrucomicrobiae bacterium]|nr:choice-of-anchor Q domain-containing protein [Verrucomicrobiae bacterium]
MGGLLSSVRQPANAMVLLIFTAGNVVAAVRYVNANNPNPAAPYTTWATAATVIQEAINVALAGDQIVVTNGVYRTGGRIVAGALSNRVAVIQPLTVSSVNGPAVTTIEGYQVPGLTNGDEAVRCVYLTNGAALSGFTLTNGATFSAGDDNLERSGGAVWCESAGALVSNCTLTGCSASLAGSGAYYGTLNNCRLAGNWAGFAGGAAYFCTLNDCTLTDNSACYGAGAYACTLSNCTLSANSAGYEGGGAAGSMLSHCTLTDNSSGYEGGGAGECTLNNCTLHGNVAAVVGGGASECTMTNCVLATNWAASGGGTWSGVINNCTLSGNLAVDGAGAYGGTLNNCVVTGNRAQAGGGVSAANLNNCNLTGNSADYGGGLSFCNANNCVVYYNVARWEGPNYIGEFINYSCTTPLPFEGVGNLSDEPQLTSASHLSATSPCRSAGSPDYTGGVDIDGEPWANPPSIGCDQVNPGHETGSLTMSIHANYTNVTRAFPVELAAQIDGQLTASRWEFGDGTVVSNRPYATHQWTASGDYPVVLRAYNQTYPAGISATILIHVADEVHYVAVDSSNPVPPYNSWATAAKSIQEAVDAQAAPGALVLVSNGVYQTGGRIVIGGTSSRVAVASPLTLRSVNGPQATVIDGGGTMRCVSLTNGAVLEGFTLTNGATVTSRLDVDDRSGGGVWCESTNAVVSGCLLIANSASFNGGGAYSGILMDCTLGGNSAGSLGAGSWKSILLNCVLTNNLANNGGGSAESTLVGCTIAGNFARLGGGAASSTLIDCALIANAGDVGGGAYQSWLTHCNVSSNSAYYTGGGAMDSSLVDCILIRNLIQDGDGGGAHNCTLTNCSLAGNLAILGGGAMSSLLHNCSLMDNAAYDGGGAAFASTLNNCSLTGNASYEGGGVYNCTLNNSIAYGNYNTSIAGTGSNYFQSTLNHCCTTPLPTNGVGNFTNAPLFLFPIEGNLRLASNSPCINAGNNSDVPAGLDLDGHPRIVGGTVDVGAYEFQAPQSSISYAWLQQYGLPADGSADLVDSDGDGLNNWQEWRCLTDPLDRFSVLHLLSPFANPDLTVCWPSELAVSYFLERATNLTAPFVFAPVARNIPGNRGTTCYTDTNSAGALLLLYRVGIE